MSALAHVLEQAGIATVAIASIRSQAVAGRAPRSLYAQFPLGRPLGRPADAVFQTAVIEAAFALLPRTDVPVLEDYPIVIDDESDTPLACEIPLSDNPGLSPAVREAIGLRAAYERRLAATGRTLVSRLGGADLVHGHIEALERIAAGTPYTDCGLAVADIAPAALDVRAYFEEAAVAIAEHTPAARQAESWFFRSTHTGDVLRRARAAIMAADGPRSAWFPIVPAGQPT